jgi:prolyl oligopeptidase
MKAQSDHAAAVLARIPGRATMLERLKRYDASVPARAADVVREPGDLWFFQRRGVDDNQLKLFARQGLNGRETVLVDPDALQRRTGKPHAINFYSVAPGGARVAYGLSQQGSEAAVLHLIDVKSASAIGTPIPRADFGAVSWAPDGQHFVFNRLQELKPGMPATDKYQKSQVLLLRAGDPVERAQPVFGVGVPGVQMGPAELPFVTLSHDGRWAFGFAINGTQREFTLYLAPQAGVLAGKPQWQRLFDASAEITGATYSAGTLYLLSHRGAPRFQVLALDLAQPELSRAKLIVPPSARVVTAIAAAADALYIEARDGNVKRLYKRAHGASDAPALEVPLPLAGSFSLNSDEGGNGAADPRLPGLVLDLQGWTRARQIYLIGADGRAVNTGLQAQGPYDAPADIVATEVQVKSHDGAMVPMSIIHKRGIALDGNHPTLLYGYASYGNTEEPVYGVTRMAWLEAGGVFAVANPRGSGVHGEDWYRAGFQATKPNTWKDFIACAEWLIAQRYSNPQRLAIWGGSAGGILVGRAMTERHDLFAAVVPQVGVLDMVRAEVTPNGVPNIPEFGTRTTEPGFRALLAMSTYHHVRDGVKYPAVLLVHGVNDPRVEVWQSTKAAARLMAASTSGKPVLLRLDYDAGHGIGSTKEQILQERADVFAFCLWQMGVPGYQP